jgi:predicted dithiol-disulfide oxidoreductase (DUF899 family)
MTRNGDVLPISVTREEWQNSRNSLLKKEKELTRKLDALAAERRRLPVLEIGKPYTFDGPSGKVNLLDLFEGRRQLIVYHFMFAPEWEKGCIGCSTFADSVGHLAHLHARDTSFAFVSRAPLEKLERFKKRMGWTVPWYSSHGSDFNFDLGATNDSGEHHMLSAFLRNGDSIFLTYQTAARGVDRLNLHFNLLDLTLLGRQEEWEDSPEGWPQTQPYEWWQLHDEYEN